MVITNLDSTYTRCSGLWQYDYGQVLRLQNSTLPACAEIHFSLSEKGGESITRLGTSRDGAMDVTIPDSLLENGNTSSDYTIYAFLYLATPESGKTEYKIALSVRSRPKPESFEKPEDAELFREAIAAVNESAESAQKAAEEAESWAHGKDEYPDRENDNAKYYAKTAKDESNKIAGKVADGKKEIDHYIEQKKQELKGDTGNVNFAAFQVVRGRLKMYSDPTVDKVRFARKGSRLTYRLAM